MVWLYSEYGGEQRKFNSKSEAADYAASRVDKGKAKMFVIKEITESQPSKNTPSY